MGRLAIQVILPIIWCISLCDAQVSLMLCDVPIKDKACVLQCLTPDLTQSVVFKKDNAEYASRKYILGTLSCTSIYPSRSLISQQSSPAITFLNITQLSRAGDQGLWTCDFGSSGSSAQTLTVLTLVDQSISISQNVEININDINTSFEVTLTVTCSSAISVWAELSNPKGNVLHRETLVVNKGPACFDLAENIYTAVFSITNTIGLTGSGHSLTFKVQLSGNIGPVYEIEYPFSITFPNAQVTLQLCDTPIKDEICVLECHTPDLTQSVVFKNDNTEYASCKFILGTLSCTSIYPSRSLISQQSSPAAVTFLNITQLSRAGDQGSWTCDFGRTGSSAQTLTVLTAPTQRSISGDVNIDYCTGDVNAIYDVTLTVNCSSAINVWAELSSPTTGIVHTERLPVTKCPACYGVSGNIYTAVYRITSTTGGLTGDNYTLTFKTQLSGGIGQVYETIYTSDISFPCPPHFLFGSISLKQRKTT